MHVVSAFLSSVEMMSWLDRTNRSKIDLYLCGWSSFIWHSALCGEVWEQHCLSVPQSQGSLDLEASYLHELSGAKWQVSQRPGTSSDQYKFPTQGEGVISLKLRELIAGHCCLVSSQKATHTICFSTWSSMMGEHFTSVGIFLVFQGEVIVVGRGVMSASAHPECLLTLLLPRVDPFSHFLSFHLQLERCSLQEYFHHV